MAHFILVQYAKTICTIIRKLFYEMTPWFNLFTTLVSLEFVIGQLNDQALSLTRRNLFLFSARFVDDDFQRRLDQILLDVKSLEDLINEVQSPKHSTEKEVNEKIKV